MKVFVLGGVTSSTPTVKETSALTRFCRALGYQLGDSEHQIVVCSCQPGSADRAVLDGLKNSTGRVTSEKVIVHFPDDAEIRKQWRALKKELDLVDPEFRDHRGPEFRSSDGKIAFDEMRMAYLLCQLEALEASDAVVAIGGKAHEGAALLLLAIARDKGRIILPYRVLGGAAENAYLRIEGELKARLSSHDLENLSDPDAGAFAVLGLLDKLSGARIEGPIRVFLSYSWKRSDCADLVEAILRRLPNVTVFRDERDIRQGETIASRIEEEINHQCSIFVALWSREYAESPYCHDEMELWIKRWKRQNFYLLRFDDTRPVWPCLRIRRDNRLEFRSNWPEVGNSRTNVENALQKIVADFEARSVAASSESGPATRI
jgi:TIR domain